MEKQEFKVKAKKDVDEVADKIEALKLKLNNATEEIKDKYQLQLSQLEEKKVALGKKYHELTDIAEDKWEEAKESFKTQAENLKAKIKNLFD